MSTLRGHSTPPRRRSQSRRGPERDLAGSDQENLKERTAEVELSNFTMAPDHLVETLGPLAALTFGLVWRYSQMHDKVCRASIRTLAGRLNLGKTTLLREIKKLVRAGYLQDLTPKVRNVPHLYADAGKVKFRLRMEASVPPWDTSSKRRTVPRWDSSVPQGDATVPHKIKTVPHRQLKRGEESFEDSEQDTAAASHSSLEPRAVNRSLYASKWGDPSESENQALRRLEDEFSPELVAGAIDEAATTRDDLARPTGYLRGILKRWRADGRPKKGASEHRQVPGKASGSRREAARHADAVQKIRGFAARQHNRPEATP